MGYLYPIRDIAQEEESLDPDEIRMIGIEEFTEIPRQYDETICERESTRGLDHSIIDDTE